MGVKYTAILMPAPDTMLFRPSAEDVVRLVDHLRATSWVRSPDSGPERNLYRDPADVAAELAARDTTAPFSLWYAGAPTGTEWPESDGVFRSRYCEDVKVVCATELATPRGEGFDMACDHCGADLRPQMSDAVVEIWNDDHPSAALKFIDDEFLSPAPERCRSCSRPLDVGRLAATSGEVVEEAPFALFMIAFQALSSPPMGSAEMDRALVASVSTLLGVPFRLVERWS